MSAAELAALSHAELVQLVLALQTELAALRAPGGPPPIAAAAAAAAPAPAATPQRPRATPQNSSLPPAKGFKADRAARRRAAQAADQPPAKRGPKPGHPGVSRCRVPSAQVDHVLACRPTICSACALPLPPHGGAIVARRQVLELPPITPVVIEAQRLRVRCPHCAHHTTGSYPAGFGKYGLLGPQLLAFIALFHEEQHVAYDRLRTVLANAFGVTLSEGTLVAAVARVAAALEPQATAIGAQVRSSAVVGSDETSARVDGENWWEWVFQTEDAAYHTIQRRRNTAVVLTFLDGAQPQAWISDLWKPQLAAPAVQYQICLAHQLRDLQRAIEGQQGAAQVWAQTLQTLLREAIHLRNQHGQAAVPAAAVGAIEATCDQLLGEALSPGWSADLQRRYQQHRAALFLFLRDPRVPATNNASERSLRPSVVHRKVTGGYRSDAAAAAYAVLRTVADTARKQGQAVFAIIRQALGPPVPFSLLPTTP
jgi:transposase